MFGPRKIREITGRNNKTGGGGRWVRNTGVYWAYRAHSCLGRQERGTGPLSERERERARTHSQTAAEKREAKLNTSHKVFRKKLASSDTKTHRGHRTKLFAT